MGDVNLKRWEIIGWYFSWAFVFSGICFAIYVVVRVLTQVE